MVENWTARVMEQLPLAVLFVVVVGALIVVVKGADILVDHAVTLSVKWGVPKMLIGATIVSIGTTLPEAAVSVVAALHGSPGLALGNAVGSIIADTGLILGIAGLIGVVPIEPRLVSRQSWIQVGSAALLVVAAVPWLNLGGMMSTGGRLPQAAGVLFLILLVFYLWRSISWSRSEPLVVTADDETVGSEVAGGEAAGGEATAASTLWVLLELVFGVAMVVIGSRILIPAVEETAIRLHIPNAIIAATLVAFGTSLPELVTSITAVRKGHGELAIGNVLGADVLNVLFVSGAAAAVTPGGLFVPPQFFYLFFPSMIFVIAVLRLGIGRADRRADVETDRRTAAFSDGVTDTRDRVPDMSRILAALLLVAYVITVVLGYTVR